MRSGKDVEGWTIRNEDSPSTNFDYQRSSTLEAVSRFQSTWTNASMWWRPTDVLLYWLYWFMLPGFLSVNFSGSISSNKQLDWCLRVLSHLGGSIFLLSYGRCFSTAASASSRIFTGISFWFHMFFSPPFLITNQAYGGSKRWELCT